MPILSKNHHVVAVDLLGHGQSDCSGYVHTMEAQAQMVAALLTVLKIKKATFIGHSMGGYVALALAEFHPTLFFELILINSTAYADSLERKTNRDRAIKAVKQNSDAFISMSIANLFSEKNQITMRSEIRKTKNEALKTSTQGIVAALEGMKIRKDRSFIYKVATFPITLILGEQDPVLSFQETIVQTNNTSIKLLSLPDGHMSWIENVEELQTFFEAKFNF